jgi:hypothetical protein
MEIAILKCLDHPNIVKVYSAHVNRCAWIWHVFNSSILFYFVFLLVGVGLNSSKMYFSGGGLFTWSRTCVAAASCSNS